MNNTELKALKEKSAEQTIADFKDVSANPITPNEERLMKLAFKLGWDISKNYFQPIQPQP